jgi:myo-inositol-1(or 4)-monophosphatase
MTSMLTGDPTGELAAELRAFAGELARRAGALIMAGRTTGAGSVDTKSSSTDLVTEYDRASEQLIVGAIRESRPDDGIVGEEGTDDPGTSGVHWLIDPIDGTTNFFYGLPGYAVSIAACDDAGPFAAAVYVPATDELFTAGRGAGATLDGARIGCSTTTDISAALVATGFSYLAARRLRQMARLQHIIGEVRDLRRLGAAAVDLCHVAAGRVDVYFEEHLGPWDLAAGRLIAAEAGCTLGDFDGGEVRPEEVLVANPSLFEPMRALIRAADRRLDPSA